jgi:hypothetical protein
MQQTCISAALTPDDGFTYVSPRRFVDVTARGAQCDQAVDAIYSAPP